MSDRQKYIILMVKNRTIKLMRQKIITMCALLLSSVGVLAQSVLDEQHLQYVKQHLSEPSYAQAYRALEKQAKYDLMMKPLSVMSKDYVPASGTKHDYVSLARYAWPDETKPNGLPYIMRDGISNPELNKFDRNKLSIMSDAIYRLSLAYFFLVMRIMQKGCRVNSCVVS